jgi:acyl dehydratase
MSTPWTADEVDSVQALVGQPLRTRQFNREASIDTIRHYAHGLGDDNPLWCDEEYAEAGPYGAIVAPPTFLYSVWSAGIGPGFPMLQAFHAGGRWEFARPVRAGERLIADARLLSIEERTGRRAGPMLLEVGRTTYRTPDGEVVGSNLSRTFRIPRPTTEGGLRYAEHATSGWSDAELDTMEAEIVGGQRRGAEPRHWEDVRVDESLGSRLKGPLDTSTMIAYSAGNLASHQSTDIAVRTRHLARTAPDQLPDNRPPSVQSARTGYAAGHFDPAVAVAVGMPGVYDNGWMRIGWMQQVLTDWMGDHGELLVLESSLHLPNVVGDTVRIDGEVTAKRHDDGVGLVDIALTGRRQDGAISCRANAVASLPARGRQP